MPPFKNYFKARQASVDQCLVDPQACRDGTQTFPTHTERFDKDIVEVKVNHEFKGHIVCEEETFAGFAAVKNEFLDQLIANINQR